MILTCASPVKSICKGAVQTRERYIIACAWPSYQHIAMLCESLCMRVVSPASLLPHAALHACKTQHVSLRV